MRNLKMLVLAAVATASLMAFAGAGTASATVLCSTTADPCPTGQKWPTSLDIDFTGSFNFVSTALESIDTCSGSRAKGKISNGGSSTGTVTWPLGELTWSSCTVPTSTLKKGGFEIHKIAGTSNGTVTADGISEWTVSTVFFGSCVYAVTAGTSIGDVTEGKPAILHINAVTHRVSGPVPCPETALWLGTYTLTSPSNTTLSVSSS
jgi:hypothetical protein